MLRTSRPEGCFDTSSSRMRHTGAPGPCTAPCTAAVYSLFPRLLEAFSCSRARSLASLCVAGSFTFVRARVRRPRLPLRELPALRGGVGNSRLPFRKGQDVLGSACCWWRAIWNSVPDNGLPELALYRGSRFAYYPGQNPSPCSPSCPSLWNCLLLGPYPPTQLLRLPPAGMLLLGISPCHFQEHGFKSVRHCCRHPDIFFAPLSSSHTGVSAASDQWVSPCRQGSHDPIRGFSLCPQ